MRSLCLRLVVPILVLAAWAFGQVGNGTITGTVTDPAGAVVPGATVEATNTETGVVFPAVTTNTGNYTILNLPVGTYSVSVKVQGFKNYVHTNLTVGATQVLKEDVALQVGNATTDTVTVTAEASLLKTESGDMTHNVSLDNLNQLPLLGIGTANSGTSGVRNPYNSLQTLPGVTSYASSGQFTLNGLGGNVTETMRVEGQDATSRLFGTYNYTQMAQPSADSIQEVAYQTSNYAAEFGQAGSVVINMTMKSGTNQFHGTGYEYFVNEDLNAGNPFSISTTGKGKYRPRNRRNDFGGTLGGPIYIPKIYNGHNKTFFFWNYEEFLEATQYGFTDTVPTPAFLKGDFSAISPNGTCSLCAQYGIQTTALGTPTIQTDALGRQMFANALYDPLSRATTSGGLGYANVFPNNQIPLARFDNVAQKVIALLPAATNNNLIGNYTANIGGNRYSAIPSIKIDHNLSDRDKLSFFYSQINTESQISSPLGNADGLPIQIGAYRGTFIPSRTTRLNYDRTVTPTLLLHLGAGYQHTRFDDHAPYTTFDPASIGLTGFLIHRQFPSFTGNCVIPLGSTACSGYGGLQNIGTSGQIQTLNYEEKPSFTANATWIRGNHTYKIGAELYLNQVINGSFAGVTLATTALATATAPANYGATAQPFTPTGSLGAFNQGAGFANFLLGDYTSTLQTAQLNYRNGQQQWGIFLQDSWKLNRRLTLDYGLRWDYATPLKEQYGRLGQLSTSLANANAGGRLGATIFANTCKCSFYQPTYPYAVGPRLGVAYQLNEKTVFRGGFGINYQFIGATGGSIVSTNGSYPLTGVNPFVNIETPGAIVAPAWPVTDPNRYPVAGTIGGAPTNYVPDANQNRPPRIMQWSVGVQREITRNLIAEAAYVANVGVWEQAATFGGTSPLGYFSQIPASTFAQYGLYPYPGTGPCSSGTGVCSNASYNNDADRQLLTQPLNSTAVQTKLAAAGYKNFSPYAGFPATNSLQAALYPYPQFGSISPTGSPTGNSKYNSLQVKMTKRLSHGLQASGAYTFAKGFVRPTPQDFFNPNANPWQLQQIPPQVLTFNATYTVPKQHWLPKYGDLAVRDWEVGFFANYQSGIFLTPPTSLTANYLPSEDIRIPGVPLYLKDINDIHNYNPYTDIVLNPAAWKPVPTNSVGPAVSTLYPDFRGPRQPKENANIGRNFRIKERFNLYIRGEFVNIFNRTLMPNPCSATSQTGCSGSNPAVTPSKNGAGAYINGFGVINAYQIAGTSSIFTGRTGTIIARLTF